MFKLEKMSDFINPHLSLFSKVHEDCIIGIKHLLNSLEIIINKI